MSFFNTIEIIYKTNSDDYGFILCVYKNFPSSYMILRYSKKSKKIKHISSILGPITKEWAITIFINRYSIWSISM